MGRLVFFGSVLVLIAQIGACSNLGQTTVTPVPTEGSGGSSGSDGGIDIQFAVDVAPPPPKDGPTFEAGSMPTCVKAVPKIKNVPPDVLIVLDRSASMLRGSDDQTCSNASGNCAGGDKWTQVTAALNTVLPKTQDSVNWGLMFFGDAHVNGMTCEVGTMADVAPATGNAMAIRTAMAGTSPGSLTPTTVAVKNAAAYLKNLHDDLPKFILLATDGLPTCGTSTSSCAAGGASGSVTGSGGAGGRTGAGGRAAATGTGGRGGATGTMGTGMGTMCDDAAAIAAVKDAHDIEMIPTFVVGIATAGMADATLNWMAVNGGFPKTGGTTQYYSVASNDELQAALASITTMAKTCFFGIDPPIDDMHKIEKVSADGRDLGSADFMQVGNTGVQLIDQACKDFTEGTIKDVVVQVNCNG